MLTPPIVNDGIALAGKHNVVRGNNITGPTIPEGSGIHLLGEFGIETTIMSGNTIKDVANALFLEQTFTSPAYPVAPKTASTFAQISLNTFTGYTNAAHAIWDSTSPVPFTVPYTLPSELSVGGQGNYWGLPCSPSGPSGFDPAKVDPANPPPPPPVIDSHPFGNPAFTPPPCS